MRYIDLTLRTPEQNLALDEALLRECESGRVPGMLRFWEPLSYFVVVGYAGRVHVDVNRAFCDRNNIPILRRISGGGTVLQGPGCLNYSLIFKMPDLNIPKGISETNALFMHKHREALRPLVSADIHVQGYTDLVIGNRKFSGNAQCRRHKALLFHGTFLIDLELSKIKNCLPVPAQQPAYRKQRSHRDFLTHLKLERDVIKDVLKKVWGASEILRDAPRLATEKLVQEKYANSSWNQKL